MDIKCPKGNHMLHSRNAWALHMLEEEGCYPSSWDRIADTLEYNLMDRIGKVEFLLRLIPGTRGSDQLLEKWHAVIFQKRMIYDYSTHTFRERHEPTVQQAAHTIKQDNLARPKRAIMRLDKVKHNKDGTARVQHECLLPSYQTQLMNEISYEEYRRLYARM